MREPIPRNIRILCSADGCNNTAVAAYESLDRMQMFLCEDHGMQFDVLCYDRVMEMEENEKKGNYEGEDGDEEEAGE